MILYSAIIVGFGGFFGAASRFLLNSLIQRTTEKIPIGTLVVNTLGCLLLGFLLAMFVSRSTSTNAYRLLLAVGFIGSFTTFSSFSYENYLLLSNGQWISLSVNVALNVVGCIMATAAGILVAKVLTASLTN